MSNSAIHSVHSTVSTKRDQLLYERQWRSVHQYAVAALFAWLALPAHAQSAELDEQFWKPFLRAMNGLDAQAFTNFLSRDVVQISSDRGVIRDYAGFSQQINDAYAAFKERQIVRRVEFRSTKRVSSDSLAFEAGYFKIDVVNTTTGKRRTDYGAYEMVLRKERAGWRIVADHDSESVAGALVTAAQFEQAQPIELPGQ